MSRGLGNPYRLMGAARKRERLAWERIASGHDCEIGSCRYDAIGLVQRWDGTFGYACAIHLDGAEKHGYPVLREPSLMAGETE
jgi:hypothetical protein